MSIVAKEFAANGMDAAVGKRLSQLISQAHIERSTFAQVHCLSAGQVDDLCGGTTRISAEQLYAFSRYFGVKVAWFFSDL